MSEAARQILSPNDYLQGELTSELKHEYLGGAAYAMAGGSNAHNLIAGNVFASLHARLRAASSLCRPYNSDTKIRLRLAMEVRFYYPDASVICSPNPPTDSFQDQPSVIVEVLSESTRRIDEGEKKAAYLGIPTLTAYLLFAQQQPEVTVHRRTDAGFSQRQYRGLDQTVRLGCLDIGIPLAEVYEGVPWGQVGEPSRASHLI